MGMGIWLVGAPLRIALISFLRLAIEFLTTCARWKMVYALHRLINYSLLVWDGERERCIITCAMLA